MRDFFLCVFGVWCFWFRVYIFSFLCSIEIIQIELWIFDLFYKSKDHNFVMIDCNQFQVILPNILHFVILSFC